MLLSNASEKFILNCFFIWSFSDGKAFPVTKQQSSFLPLPFFKLNEGKTGLNNMGVLKRDRRLKITLGSHAGSKHLQPWLLRKLREMDHFRPVLENRKPTLQYKKDIAETGRCGW